jgi:hypothetical protein
VRWFVFEKFGVYIWAESCFTRDRRCHDDAPCGVFSSLFDGVAGDVAAAMSAGLEYDDSDNWTGPEWLHVGN